MTDENESALTPERRRELHEAHEEEQRRFIAENTTPYQRLMWLEDMLEVFKDYLPPREQPYVKEFRKIGPGGEIIVIPCGPREEITQDATPRTQDTSEPGR